uniref:Double C2-like domains, alpha n=1 Tax=Hucho hucho TaxID=62062 RepID=A0A4W5PJA3_9TELE
MTLRKGKKLSITIQEHMAIDVCPGPIRPIRTISAYFPRLSPTSEPLSPKPTGSPLVLSPGGAASGMGGGGRGGLLTPLLPGVMGGGGSLSLQSSIDTSVEINSSDSDDCTALGTLEFDLRYERASSKLHCTILRAKVTSQILFTHFLSALQPNPKSSPRPCALCISGDLRECDRCKLYVNSSI